MPFFAIIDKIIITTFSRFANLNQEEAFDLACHENAVQEQVLPFEYSQTFKRIDQFGATLDFSVERSEDEVREIKQKKKEKKKMIKQRREERIAYFAARKRELEKSEEG